MITREVTITNKTGLHARPAAEFTRLASKFKSNITIIFKGNKVNAKSLLSILSAGITCGSSVSIAAEGEDGAEAVDKLAELIQSNFGE